MKLNEADWAKVFKAKCKSKQGQTVTPEERKLLDQAFKNDPKRYGAMESEVFDATVPFGSSAKWGDRKRIEAPDLTKKQWEELERCVRSPQPTYGSARARIQNILIEKGLARLWDNGFQCEATDVGRDALRRAGVKLP